MCYFVFDRQQFELPEQVRSEACAVHHSPDIKSLQGTICPSTFRGSTSSTPPSILHPQPDPQPPSQQIHLCCNANVPEVLDPGMVRNVETCKTSTPTVGEGEAHCCRKFGASKTQPSDASQGASCLQLQLQHKNPRAQAACLPPKQTVRLCCTSLDVQQSPRLTLLLLPFGASTSSVSFQLHTVTVKGGHAVSAAQP